MTNQEAGADRYCAVCGEIAVLALRTLKLFRLHILTPSGRIGEIVDMWHDSDSDSTTVFLCHDHAQSPRG